MKKKKKKRRLIQTLIITLSKEIDKIKNFLVLSKNLMQFDAATLLNNYTYIFKNLKKILQFDEAAWRNHGIYAHLLLYSI